jgi:carboxyl-terminal processing protease
MSRPTRIIILLCLPVLMLGLGWNMGVQFERETNREQVQRLAELFEGGTGSGAIAGDPEKTVDISLLWSVWRLLQTHYIQADRLRAPDLVYGATKGLVDAAGDPYTAFMTPKENSDFRESLQGHLQGIGAELALRDNRIVVVAPIKGSPADKAGILPEDVIVEVDGASIEGQTLTEVVRKIRGQRGTKVALGVERKGSPAMLTITITRDDITVPSVEFEFKQTDSGPVGYIAVNQFGNETLAEMVKALQPMQRTPNVKGLILDLRYNGGGYLTGAVDMASLFLREGKVVSVARRQGEPQRHDVSGNPILPDIPLVILINQGTASAAEIVAGALQDYKRATVVGVTSFGKGTVQEVIDLPGGSSLRVTVAQWLTPNGRNLGKEGVTPDIVVERTIEDLQADRDPQLEKALETVSRL